MATFNFNCPQCGNLLAGEDEWRGMETQCPECKKNIIIPPTEQPLLVTPNHSSNILPQTSTSTTTHKAIKKISRFDNKILRIIKILLFVTSCYFLVNAVGIFNQPVTRPSILPSDIKSGYGDSAYKLKSEYEVSVADSTYATYKNTVSIAKNTNDIQRNTASIVENSYSTIGLLRYIVESDRITQCVLLNLGISIFFLFLSIFIDKILLPLNSSKK